VTSSRSTRVRSARWTLVAGPSPWTRRYSAPNGRPGCSAASASSTSFWARDAPSQSRLKCACSDRTTPARARRASSSHAGDPAPARGPELGRQLEQVLKGRVDVLAPAGAREAEAERAVDGADGHGRLDSEPAKRRERRLAGALQHRGDVLEDRAGEPLGQLLLARRGHQVDLGDEDAAGRQLLNG